MKVALIALFVLGIATAVAVPATHVKQERIVGGSVTNINQYPSIAGLLITWNWSQWILNCGGSIINQRHILTAAHCIQWDPPNRWRARLGSNFASSGGVQHDFNAFILHPNYNAGTMDNDIAIIRTAGTISYSNLIQAARYAGANYNVADNQVLWAAGWGHTVHGGSNSEQLRHVQIYSINQNICNQRYSPIRVITNNMLCSGVLDVGGRDTCQNDSGGPVYHNGVVVGVVSFGTDCGLPQFPGVNARVSRYTSWIQSNS